MQMRWLVPCRWRWGWDRVETRTALDSAKTRWASGHSSLEQDENIVTRGKTQGIVKYCAVLLSHWRQTSIFTSWAKRLADLCYSRGIFRSLRNGKSGQLLAFDRTLGPTVVRFLLSWRLERGWPSWKWGSQTEQDHAGSAAFKVFQLGIGLDIYIPEEQLLVLRQWRYTVKLKAPWQKLGQNGKSCRMKIWCLTHHFMLQAPGFDGWKSFAILRLCSLWPWVFLSTPNLVNTQATHFWSWPCLTKTKIKQGKQQRYTRSSLIFPGRKSWRVARTFWAFNQATWSFRRPTTEFCLRRRTAPFATTNTTVFRKRQGTRVVVANLGKEEFNGQPAT